MSIKNAISIEDLRKIAKQKLPRMVFDYIDGGADDEITLRRNHERYKDIELVWNSLQDISKIDCSAKVFGQDSRLPLLIAPTASSRLFSPKYGEKAVANAAHNKGLVYSISTIGSTSIEEISKLNQSPKLFQIYVWKDRGLVREIIARAKEAGFTGIILTVDVPVAGNRERDPRNKFSIPPKPSIEVAMQVLAKPQYLFDMAISGPITAANFTNINHNGGIIDFINSQFDRSVTWKDAEWMHNEWGGEFAIKGISTPKDAENCLKIGVNHIWISNHGGRQLDTSPATIDTLPAIAQKIAGRGQIIIDGGIRRGTDILKALALGANAVAIGRPYLYGLAAGGQKGVEKAIDILETELLRAMALCGITNLSQINSNLIFKK